MICKLVSYKTLEASEFNLNIARYAYKEEEEDIHDIEAHMRGGIPKVDIDKVKWTIFEDLKSQIFEPMEDRPKYCRHKFNPTELHAFFYALPYFFEHQAALLDLYKAVEKIIQRYGTSLLELRKQVRVLEDKTDENLRKMGIEW
jgi:hypothetical protein